MHLIVPFAGTGSEAGQQALQGLALPQLTRLLARLAPARRLGGDALSPNPPHEQALAAAWGWPSAPDVALPFAAREALALGLPGASEQAWAWLTPVHLQVGADQVRMAPPAALALSEADARRLLQAVRDLFESEGFSLHFARPQQWLASHALFDGLAAASIDRAAGRNVDPWLPEQRSARLLRRLQNEVQMLLHTHPLNAEREAAGLASVNSVWISGCGRLPAGPAAAEADTVQLDDRLRGPALAEDWAAWQAAWQALDAQVLPALAATGERALLTLCGERHAQSFAPAPAPGLWQRLTRRTQALPVAAVLEAL